jgi:glucose-1-phosphate cytidylyltransferase
MEHGDAMKVVILAGGFGTRLGEETVNIPKPMVRIGQHPMLWHIMKFYASYGFEEFVVALGYKAEVVKNFFLQFADMASDLTINLAAGTVERRRRHQERWTVHLIDTGLDTLTGGRVLRLAPIIGGKTFMLTYGDGLSDVPLDRLLGHHRAQGKLATVTAVSAPARFGGIAFDGDRIVGFAEKHAGGDGWINGGYMVMEPGVFDYLRGDADSLEVSVLERLGRADQLAAYRHAGFWQCMDTMRDKQALERLWASDAPPWKRW